MKSAVVVVAVDVDAVAFYRWLLVTQSSVDDWVDLVEILLEDVVVVVFVVVVVVVVVEVDVVVAVVVVGVEQFAPHIDSSMDNSIGSRNTKRQKCSHTFYSVSNEIKVFILHR